MRPRRPRTPDHSDHSAPPEEVSDGLAQLHTAPGHLLRRARQFHDALWLREVGDRLTPLQFAVLTALDTEPGLSQRELGDRVALDKSTLSDVTVRLSRRGYATRNPDPEDGRSRVVTITSAGRKVLAATRPAVVRIGHQILDCLDESEQAEFSRLLAKLVFSEAASDATPGDRRLGDPTEATSGPLGT